MFEWKNQKFVEKNKLQEFQTDAGHQMDNLYASSIQRFEERSQELQESRFQVGGVKHKDGYEMRQIKWWQGKLAEMMREPIPRSQEKLAKALFGMNLIYENLTDWCKDYIKSHKNPFTSSGKARLSLVKGTLGLAQQEWAKLEEKSKELCAVAAKEENKEKQFVWGNVLGLIRGSDFDLDQMKELGTAGAATSELQTFQSGDETFYFKEDEKLEEAGTAFENHYLKDCTDEKDKQVYQILKRIMETKVFGGFALDVVLGMDPNLTKALKEKGDKPEELDRLCKIIKNKLTQSRVDMTGLDWEDKRIKEIIRDVLPRYELWLNRKDACLVAGIENGQSLSVRNVLTSRMAAVLHIPHLMAISNTATVHHGGQQKQEGIVMEKAKGIEHAKLNEYAQKKKMKIIYTPEAIRQFSCLQLFDMICGQVDRHYGNRFVHLDEVDGHLVVTGVQGIDHDLSFGLLKYEDIRDFKRGHLPGCEDDGAFVLPVLDKELVEMLRNLDDNNLKHFLGDFMGDAYLEALLDRKNGVMKKIEEDIAAGKVKLLKKDEWDLKTANLFKKKWNFYPDILEDEIGMVKEGKIIHQEQEEEQEVEGFAWQWKEELSQEEEDELPPIYALGKDQYQEEREETRVNIHQEEEDELPPIYALGKDQYQEEREETRVNVHQEEEVFQEEEDELPPIYALGKDQYEEEKEEPGENVQQKGEISQEEELPKIYPLKDLI